MITQSHNHFVAGMGIHIPEKAVFILKWDPDFNFDRNIMEYIDVADVYIHWHKYLVCPSNLITISMFEIGSNDNFLYNKQRCDSLKVQF